MYAFTFSVFKLARKCTLQRAVFYSVNNGSIFSDNANFERSQKSITKPSVFEKNDLLSRKIQKDCKIIARKSSKLSNEEMVDNFICQVENAFKDVKMKDMAEAPTPSFWYTMAGLAPLALPSLSFILIGFDPNLFILQMNYSALLLAYQGGIKFGHELEHNEATTWENIPWAVIPIGFSMMSLIIPDVLSPLTLAVGFLLSAFADLMFGYFSAWYKAVKLAFVIPAVASLLIAFLWNLFY